MMRGVGEGHVDLGGSLPPNGGASSSSRAVPRRLAERNDRGIGSQRRRAGVTPVADRGRDRRLVARVSLRIRPVGRVTRSDLGASRWHDVETYYLKLVNCTRTGGWVRHDGSCAWVRQRLLLEVREAAHAQVRPLERRPKWAKHLVAANDCAHGNPAPASPGPAIAAPLGRERRLQQLRQRQARGPGQPPSMQAEKGSGGGHWKNIKNPAFKRVGIGVWRDHGRTRVADGLLRPKSVTPASPP